MRKISIVFMVFLVFLGCDKEEQITDIIQFPRITINNLTISENSANPAVTVGLTWAYTETVSVKYTVMELESQSAEEDVDFLAKEGEIVFQPGDTAALISIDIIDDAVFEAEEQFQVLLSDPIYGELLSTLAIVTISNDDSELIIDGSGYDAPSSYSGLSRVWEDEFSGTSLDLDKWTHEIGGNGWGNNELQYYTDRTENSFVASGYLFIEAKEEKFGESDYTSARLVTQDKYEFKFGRIDIRAKLPEGRGLWPALWMLGENFPEVGWPACGEIDIMELIGSQPNISHGTVHFGNNAADRSSVTKSNYLPGSKFSSEFHVFSLVWNEDYVDWQVDGKTFHQVVPDDLEQYEWPFNDKFFFIFNVAVGGNWPGSPNESTVFPQRMLVDYVRVYQ